MYPLSALKEAIIRVNGIQLITNHLGIDHLGEMNNPIILSLIAIN